MYCSSGTTCSAATRGTRRAHGRRCRLGAGDATAPRTLPPFHSVELAGANDVTVRVGGRQLVVVHGDDNLLGRVTTTVRRSTLVIDNSGSLRSTLPVSVRVTVPALSMIRLSGSGVITVRDVRGPALEVRFPGTGLLHVQGTVDRLAVSLSGTGDAELGELLARHVHAAVAGSGRVLVHPGDSLDATVAGTGVVVYVGDPSHVTTHVTGTGAVSRG